MANDWKLTLSVVAAGEDETHVFLRRVNKTRPPYVVVRVGAVMAHCLGPAAIGSCGQAWAAARARLEASGSGFPGYDDRSRHRPTSEALAVPSGSVVFDGAQRWAVSVTRGQGVLVTIGCLQVHVHDRAAFDLHVQAWSQAVDLAAVAYPGRQVPFARMTDNARYNQLDRGVGMWLPPGDDNPGPERGLEL